MVVDLGIVAGATGIFYTIYYFGENYAVAPVLNNLPACIYCWFSILAILAFMKKYGDAENQSIKMDVKKILGNLCFSLSSIGLCSLLP